MRIVVVLLAVALVAGLGAANVLLLDYGAGRSDPVGRLSPLTRVAPPAPVQPAQHTLRRAGREGPDD